jgi:hypothetical protein
MNKYYCFKDNAVFMTRRFPLQNGKMEFPFTSAKITALFLESVDFNPPEKVIFSAGGNTILERTGAMFSLVPQRREALWVFVKTTRKLSFCFVNILWRILGGKSWNFGWPIISEEQPFAEDLKSLDSRYTQFQLSVQPKGLDVGPSAVQGNNCSSSMVCAVTFKTLDFMDFVYGMRIPKNFNVEQFILDCQAQGMKMKSGVKNWDKEDQLQLKMGNIFKELSGSKAFRIEKTATIYISKIICEQQQDFCFKFSIDGIQTILQVDLNQLEQQDHFYIFKIEKRVNFTAKSHFPVLISFPTLFKTYCGMFSVLSP